MLKTYRHSQSLLFLKLTAFFLAFSCVSVSMPEDFAVIDCLLPGQIRQLGRHATYITKRQYIKTTRETCADRGGEQNITQENLIQLAQESENPETQYHLGTNFEKGEGGKQSYELAAQWYRKAAEQDYALAAINLGRLYEKGLGVPQNQIEAFKWYAKASGFDDSANLTRLLTPNIQAESKIRELEGKLSEKEKLILQLRKNLITLNAKHDQLQNQLKEQTTLANKELGKLQHQEEHYQVLKAKLDEKIAKAGSSTNSPALQLEIDTLKAKIAKRQQQLRERNEKIRLLQQKIAALERETKKQTKSLTAAPPVDLGFDGPSIEIIDPQIINIRGIHIVEDTDDMSLDMVTGGRQTFTGRITASAGLRMLRVNGKIVEADKEGNFIAPLPSHDPENNARLEIVAFDIQDKHDSLIINVKYGEDSPSSTEVIPLLKDLSIFGNYHALVIGNDHYDDENNWPSLKNAISDAIEVKKVLEERYRFQVKLVKNATRLTILQELNKYREELTKQDNLLIYYAGHGALQKEIDRGYWIPVDAKGKDNSKWLSLSDVRDQLGLIPAKHIMIVADSCFAGKLTRNAQGQLRPGLSEKDKMELYRFLAQKPVRTAMTSGGIMPVLDIGESQGHSVFAEAFLGVLKNNNSILEAEHVYLAVRGRVMPVSKRLNFVQLPTYNPIHMAGHGSLGDFIFVPYL